MLKKLLIRTWRGPLPPWTNQFRASIPHLAAHGWDFLLVDDWESVRRRAYTNLGISIPEQIDTRKPGHYDPALGVLFQDVLTEYDFWGHFNLDCVYGRLHHFLPDVFLDNIDIYGNDPGAICGPFTIYRNTRKVNELFKSCVDWERGFESPTFTGWDELEFSEHVKGAALRGEVRFVSGFLQAHDHMTIEHTRLAQGMVNFSPSVKENYSAPHPVRWWQFQGQPDLSLVDNVTDQEIMMYHFNQTRRWPLG